MRLYLAWLAVFLSFPVLWMLAQESQLSKHSDAHQMFLLRDELNRNPGSPDFYSGEVACAFNEMPTCEEKFKKVIAAEPNSIEAKQAHHILAYASLREGRYGRSLSEIDAVLAIDAKDADANETRPFFEALSHFPDQKVQESGTGKAAVQMDGGKLPLLINGRKASYFFDTGANLSTLSESEALRLGMEIKDVNAGGGSADVNGNRVLFRIALAKSLVLGGIVLENAAFLVTSNEQQPFVDMEIGQRGLIGLPVLRTLGHIEWSRENVFKVDRSPKPANVAAANLCFDDLSLVAQASFQQHELPFLLDTGATTTDLWPKFAVVAAKLIRKSGTRESHTVTGVGGSQNFDAISVPKVVLRLGGMSVALQPAHVLETELRAANKWFYGNLGNDLLGQAQEVSIDFRTMTLELGPSATQRLHAHLRQDVSAHRRSLGKLPVSASMFVLLVAGALAEAAVLKCLTRCVHDPSSWTQTIVPTNPIIR
jgi:predicted aspartyl protease